MVDVKKQLSNAVESGKVLLGSNKTVDSLLHDKPKLVLLSSNCPAKQAETIIYYCRLADVPYARVQETSIELGSSIGRPHPISVAAVMEEGESGILEVGR